jgi:endo-1,4-beta-xylanase
MPNPTSTIRTPLLRLLPVVIACITVGACSDTSMSVLDVNGADSGARQSRTQLDVAGGQSQVGQVNTMLATPLGVKVTNQAGNPLVGVTVYWSFATGGGAATAAGAAAGSVTTTTDNGGVARVYWLLGTQAGDQEATAGLSSNTNKGNGKGNGSLTFSAQATPGDPASVVVYPAAATLGVGNDTTLTAAVSDKWSNLIANAQVAWSASPSAVATVSGKGRVSTLSPGSATVTATAGGAIGTAWISVTGAPSSTVAHVVASPSSLSFDALGSSAKLSAAATDAASAPVTADFQWRSLDASVATVDASGLVKALANGSTSVIVSATCCAPADTVPVSVAQVPQSVTLSSSLLTLPVGGSDSLHALVKDANGFLIADATLSWSSSDAGVAGVDSSGVVRAVAAGTATITAAVAGASGTAAPSGASAGSGVTGQASVVVSAPTAAADPDTVTDLKVSAVTDSSVTLRWTQVDDGTGSPAKYALRYGAPTITWGSAYVTEVSLDGTAAGATMGYTFAGLRSGTTYQFQLVAYRGTLNVDAVFGALSNIVSGTTASPITFQTPTVTVTPASMSFTSLNATAQLSAVAKDSTGSTVANPGFTWTTLNSAIATVTAAGLVTAKGIGHVGIVVSAACCGSDTTTVDVTQVPATVTVSPSSVSGLSPGDTRQLTATVQDANGSMVIGASVAWNSTSTTIVTVDGNGLVQALAPGAATVTATSGGQSGSAGITVGTPTLRGLAAQRGFLVGAAVITNDGLLSTDPVYRQTLANQYNSVAGDNAMKFSVIHPTSTRYDFSHADELVAFAQANGMVIHGHTLVWHESLSDWVTNGSYGKAQLLAILKDHITTVVGRYAGKVASWDVLNEGVIWNGAMRPDVWLNTIGPEYVDSAFVWAHRADPSAELFYNDFGIEGPGEKTDSVLALVTRLRARGVPVDGVGFQFHAFPDGPIPSASTVRATFARFANAGFDVRVSEMDVMISDNAGPSALVQQAVVYRDVLDACLRQARCTGFMTWGFTDLYSWIPRSWPGYGRGLPFDTAYAPKPAFDSLAARLRR